MNQRHSWGLVLDTADEQAVPLGELFYPQCIVVKNNSGGAVDILFKEYDDITWGADGAKSVADNTYTLPAANALPSSTRYLYRGGRLVSNGETFIVGECKDGRTLGGLTGPGDLSSADATGTLYGGRLLDLDAIPVGTTTIPINSHKPWPGLYTEDLPANVVVTIYFGSDSWDT